MCCECECGFSTLTEDRTVSDAKQLIQDSGLVIRWLGVVVVVVGGAVECVYVFDE